MTLPAMLLLVLLAAILLLFILRWRNRAKSRELAQLELRVALQQGAATIPGLLDAIDEYASYERAVFSEARAAAQDANTADNLASMITAHDRFVAASGDLLAIVQVYPDLQTEPETAKSLEQLSESMAQAESARQRVTDQP